MPVIFSTLTAANEYRFYKPGNDRSPAIVEHSVVIGGGANNVNRRNLITPRGVATTVSDEDLEYLKQNEVFQLHMKNGFITIDAAKDERDADKVAADMEGRSPDAPTVDADYEEGQEPFVNKDGDNPVVVTEAAPTPRRAARTGK